MASRIELDDRDRHFVERARDLRAEAEPTAHPTDPADYRAWKVDQAAKLLAALDLVLGVLDGGERQ
ncbi:hypothetical protein [Streptomyces fungicidicus]|uniref:hypothetical protein n=1 Tax=Streptomyces fungicidicus TaxID=68203 RepID=UPI00380E7608